MSCCLDKFQNPDFMKRFSAATRSRDGYPVAEILKDLRSEKPLLEVATNHSKLFEGFTEELAHLTKHWYMRGSGYWPRQPVEKIVRAGYAHAIRLMYELDLPIDTAWSDDQLDGRFMWVITVSPLVLGCEKERVIQMTLHTPPTGMTVDDEAQLIDDESIWLIELDSNGECVPRHAKRLR